MATPRMRRVDRAIREVVADHIAADLADPRIGFVTVTDVKTSNDLSHARVYVTVLGDEEARDTALDALGSSAGVLQAMVGAELRIKRTPTLDFIYDESTDRGLRISELVDDD